MIRGHGQYEGGGWPYQGLKRARLMKWSKEGRLMFSVSRHSKDGGEKDTGCLYYPMQIASVLAALDNPQAQVALMDQAIASDSSDRVAFLNLTTESVKRFGSRLEPRQVDRLVDMVISASGDEGTAAAALAGAMGLPSDRLIPLIIGDQSTTVGQR